MISNIEQQIKHVIQAQREIEKELLRFDKEDNIVSELKDHSYILGQASESLKVLKILKDYLVI